MGRKWEERREGKLWSVCEINNKKNVNKIKFKKGKRKRKFGNWGMVKGS